MIKTIQTQTDKLRRWARTNPKKALPLLWLAALLAILIISVLIALIIQKDEKTPPQLGTVQLQPAQVIITKDGFIPATIEVKKGTKIIWTNTDEGMHQIQANPHPTGESLPGLQSEILNNQQTYEYTADTSGTFGYHDKVTPTTNGTINVKD